MVLSLNSYSIRELHRNSGELLRKRRAMQAALPYIATACPAPRKACQCIAAIGATDVIDNLPDLFHDEAPSVRQAALDALATYPDHAKTLGAAVVGC